MGIVQLHSPSKKVHSGTKMRQRLAAYHPWIAAPRPMLLLKTCYRHNFSHMFFSSFLRLFFLHHMLLNKCLWNAYRGFCTVLSVLCNEDVPCWDGILRLIKQKGSYEYPVNGNQIERGVCQDRLQSSKKEKAPLGKTRLYLKAAVTLVLKIG